MPESVPLYDRFSESYDVMVSWEERLQNEGPSFRRAFDRVKARRVLDVGTATGGHATHFASLGLEAVGVDPSTEMVRKAQERAAGRTGVSFAQAGFGELQQKVGGGFDVVTCLGNTLPHANTSSLLKLALSDMAAVLNPGGQLVVQLLNYDRILSERRRFLGASGGEKDGVEYLFFRFYDFDDDQLTFNVVTFRKEGGKWSFTPDATQLRAIRREELSESLDAAGFRPVEWYGSLSGDVFDPATSGDMVFVATKG